MTTGTVMADTGTGTDAIGTITVIRRVGCDLTGTTGPTWGASKGPSCPLRAGDAPRAQPLDRRLVQGLGGVWRVAVDHGAVRGDRAVHDLRFGLGVNLGQAKQVENPGDIGLGLL